MDELISVLQGIMPLFSLIWLNPSQ